MTSHAHTHDGRRWCFAPAAALLLLMCPNSLAQAPLTDAARDPRPPAVTQVTPRSVDLFGAFGADNRLETAQLDAIGLMLEDAVFGGLPLRMGVVEDFAPITGDDGRWTQLDDGGWLWTMSFHAPGAKALRLRIEPWLPPRGAELIVYNADEPTEARGPLTAAFSPASGVLWTPTIYGETVNLEYYLPPGLDRRAAHTRIEVNGLLDQYRTMPGGPVVAMGGPEDELPCHLDVTCYSPWNDNEADAVAALSFVANQYGFFCSGAMLNRNPTDFTSMFMTATHCGVTDANADTLLVTWFYQTAICNGTPPNPATLPQTLGCTVLAQDVVTDWTLVGLEFNAPGNVLFAGWDAGVLPNNQSVTGIHHPDGTYKRISFGTKVADNGSRPDPNNPPNCMGGTAYAVTYGNSATDGRIEPGSSGSPLFDSSRRVRGTLSCGGPFVCTGTEGASYGRFDQIFSSLAPYLVPTDPVYVNVSYFGNEQGTVSNPFNEAKEGVFAVIAGSNVFIESGTYSERFTLDKPMTLNARNGLVRIGF